ncbi:Golgi reassembly-stacking protein 2 [Chytriomyces hyalinus]|nr:Golgi reassembly-stacking protein 2 [Chytriomyces hyalinus]
MGAGQSSLKVEMDASPLRQSLSGHGYHVLSVTRGSSAHAHGIEAHFDYIVAVDGVAVADTDVTLLERAVSHHSDPSYSNASSDSKVALLVWNSRSTLVRPVSVSVPMGVTVRMCALRHARERVWRVLNVLSNSPAEDAGLHPSSDYIIGTTEADSLNSLFPLKDRDDLFRLVESRIGSSVSLTVYSSVLQSIRVVVLSPRFDWGGPGCMGCDIGYGPHHRIPVPIQSEKSNIPNASLVEKNVQTNSPLSPTLDQFGSKPLMRINRIPIDMGMVTKHMGNMGMRIVMDMGTSPLMLSMDMTHMDMVTKLDVTHTDMTHMDMVMKTDMAMTLICMKRILDTATFTHLMTRMDTGMDMKMDMNLDMSMDTNTAITAIMITNTVKACMEMMKKTKIQYMLMKARFMLHNQSLQWMHTSPQMVMVMERITDTDTRIDLDE